MTLNRSLFITIVGLIFVALFIPLFVSNSMFFPFITGKNFAFRIIVEIAALLWVVLMIRDKDYRPKWTWLPIAVGVFAIVTGVADIFSSNPVKSFLSNFERMEGWITIAHLALYFFILSSVFRTWTFWKRFFQTSLAVSVIVCINGIMQLSGAAAIHQSTSRLDATFGNATYLAVYMLFHVFFAVILLARHLKDRHLNTKSIWHTQFWYTDMIVYLYFFLIVLQSFILFFTATRGSILGLIGGFIVAAILVSVFEKETKIVRKISIGILILIALAIGAFFVMKNTDFVRNNSVLGRIASISATDNTTKARFMIWNMAWQGVTQDAKHFTIGWGQESFNYIFAKYYNPGMYGQEQWFDRSHDVVFDWLTAAGILGLLSYLSFFVLALYSIWIKSAFSNIEKSLLTGLLAGYFFHNIFVFDNIVSYMLFFMVLAYINVMSKAGESSDIIVNDPKSEANTTWQNVGIIAAVVVFAVVFYQYNVKPMNANWALINAITPRVNSTNQSSGYIYTQENYDSFKQALSYNTIGLYETREQLLDIAQKSLSTKSEDLTKQNLVNLARTEISKQLQETPNDVRYYVLGGTFLQNIGDYKESTKLLEKAAELSPNKQTLLFALGSNYFAAKQYTDALATFKKAYELDKTFDEAKSLYALVAFYVGQENITNSLLGPGPVMDARFLAAYKSTKKYDLMIAYLQKNVAAKPNDIQAQVALAAGYLTAGNRSKAISTLQNSKTLTADKNVQSQIDGFIKDIQAGKNPFENATSA